jgi:hypothetical protein
MTIQPHPPSHVILLHRLGGVGQLWEAGGGQDLLHVRPVSQIGYYFESAGNDDHQRDKTEGPRIV